MTSYADYLAAMESASALAQAELRQLYGQLDTGDPLACKAILLQAVPAIVAKYDVMAATAAAGYYETQRQAAVGGHYTAELAEGVDRGAIEAKVRYALGHIFGGDGDGA